MSIDNPRIAKVRTGQLAANKAQAGHSGVAQIGVVEITRAERRIGQIRVEKTGHGRPAGLPLRALQPGLGQIHPAQRAALKPPSGQIEFAQFRLIQIAIEEVNAILMRLCQSGNVITAQGATIDCFGHSLSRLMHAPVRFRGPV